MNVIVLLTIAACIINAVAISISSRNNFSHEQEAVQLQDDEQENISRADIGTYLGGSFASVFRDYPDIPRSVYQGELPLADAHTGFNGSYDAEQPVSSTTVEAVLLLGEGGNYSINGFYIGMTAADTESLAAAGGYTALEVTTESGREYIDDQGNTLSLIIDGGVVKCVTLTGR